MNGNTEHQPCVYTPEDWQAVQTAAMIQGGDRIMTIYQLCSQALICRSAGDSLGEMRWLRGLFALVDSTRTNRAEGEANH
jgi:hypothetical protein